MAEECTDLFCLLFPQGLHCVSGEIAGTSLQSTLHHSHPFSFDSRFCNAGTKAQANYMTHVYISYKFMFTCTDHLFNYWCNCFTGQVLVL